jgi:hypothetical protein
LDSAQRHPAVARLPALRHHRVDEASDGEIAEARRSAVAQLVEVSQQAGEVDEGVEEAAGTRAITPLSAWQAKRGKLPALLGSTAYAAIFNWRYAAAILPPAAAIRLCHPVPSPPLRACG